MKKYILTGLIISSFTWCFAADLTRYKNVEFVENLTVTQPTIVEITNLSNLGNYVVTDDNGNYIEQQSQTIRKSKIILPLQAEGCINICKNAITLADGNLDTTFDFPLQSAGIQKGKIKIIYAKPLETDSILFQTTSDSYAPTVFTLVIDGKRVLNTMQGGSAHFPKMIAQSIEIEFDYDQPIRFTEVGIGFNKEEMVTNTVRFVYQPNTKYALYLDSSLERETIPSPAINLFANNKVTGVKLEASHKNPLYKERDVDNDGIVDGIDNCPRQVNPDQKDSNGNGIGDICDDYDYDGVPTYIDNCQDVINSDQKDADKDGIGDACDDDESRLTEKYKWMPWVVFAGVFWIVIAMAYEIIKKRKERDDLE